MLFTQIIADASAVSRSVAIMAQGMLGIFVFMAIFYLVIYLLDRYVKDKKE